VVSPIAIAPPNLFVADPSPAGLLLCSITASMLDNVADIVDKFQLAFAHEIRPRLSLGKTPSQTKVFDIAIPLPIPLGAQASFAAPHKNLRRQLYECRHSEASW
jgi:hypothetical protein